MAWPEEPGLSRTHTYALDRRCSEAAECIGQPHAKAKLWHRQRAAVGRNAVCCRESSTHLCLCTHRVHSLGPRFVPKPCALPPEWQHEPARNRMTTGSSGQWHTTSPFWMINRVRVFALQDHAVYQGRLQQHGLNVSDLKSCELLLLHLCTRGSTCSQLLHAARDM